MRTFNLSALILATVGTGLLSVTLLLAAISLKPDMPGLDVAAIELKVEAANLQLQGALWFWVVVSIASASIVLAAGGYLTRAHVRQNLLFRLGLTIAIVVVIQLALESMGLHSIETAIARVNTPVVAGIQHTGWKTLDRERVLLAGSALVALIYAIAFCLQIGHDNRGTDRSGIVE